VESGFVHKALNGEVWGGVEEGRGEYIGQNSFRSGYANGLGAIRGGGGFLGMGFFAFAVKWSYVAERDGLS
jgi:hypothetical protein